MEFKPNITPLDLIKKRCIRWKHILETFILIDEKKIVNKFAGILKSKI